MELYGMKIKVKFEGKIDIHDVNIKDFVIYVDGEECRFNFEMEFKEPQFSDVIEFDFYEIDEISFNGNQDFIDVENIESVNSIYFYIREEVTALPVSIENIKFYSPEGEHYSLSEYMYSLAEMHIDKY